MRPRFSLRVFFLFITFAAAICAWCVLPSIVARRFVRVLADAKYQTADQMFVDANDRCLEKWDRERWSFRASGTLEPLTFRQLFTGHRLVRLNISYFALDQAVDRNGLVSVTPFGVRRLEVEPERYGSLIIDGIPHSTRIFKP